MPKKRGKIMTSSHEDNVIVPLQDIKLSPDYVVTQSNNLIETPQDLTLQERRIVLVLASLVQPEDDHFKTHKIKVSDLADIIGIGTRNFYKKVEQTLISLQSKSVTIESAERKLVVNWLEWSEYYTGKGYVVLKFSDRLRPVLLQIKREHTPFKLINALRLTSEKHIKIYELLKQYQKLKKRTITIGELRYYLNIPETQYKMYSHLKNRIILKAQEDIAKRTDICFTFDEHKDGQKVISLTFHIRKNTKFITDVMQNELQDKDTYQMLIRFGIRPDTAREMNTIYSEERIRENIHYVVKEKNMEDIDNVSGYILKAINEDYKKIERSEGKESSPIFYEQSFYHWLKKQYNNVKEATPEFLIEKKVIEYLSENMSEKQAVEFWTENKEKIMKMVNEQVDKNRKKGR